MKFLCLFPILFFSIWNACAQIPKNWVQHRVIDTVNLPIEVYWSLSQQVDLEDIASMSAYDDLPRLVSTSPVKGDFSAEGHSRRVHFEEGETLLETIIKMEAPNVFAYELTEIELRLKAVAKRARGMFEYMALGGDKTIITWTYGFDQKSFLARWFLGRYIKRTHQHWMEDSFGALNAEIEGKHNQDLLHN